MSDPNPEISNSSRIRDLSDLDAQIPQLLRSAGRAIQALTGSAPSDDSLPEAESITNGKDAAARASFAAHNTAFLTALQGVSARLRRQAYALEEAGIVPATATDKDEQKGGLGSFDVGWLNSRRDDIARAKEAELWREARRVGEAVAAEGGL